ncbi:MAG: cellobiose phosphorylase, partial [Acidimicrobiia bacterium]|nr:cellobiose phosphorylase [Acidimicrobiia bacterium]
FDGLRVQPSLPSHLTDVTVTRTCRGAEYRITITNTGGGEPRVSVDGQPIDESIVPYAPAGSTVTVQVAT